VLSSRRRHTRSTRDWSSDVCSSDLFQDSTHDGHSVEKHGHEENHDEPEGAEVSLQETLLLRLPGGRDLEALDLNPRGELVELLEIGRASCRKGGRDGGGESV